MRRRVWLISGILLALTMGVHLPAGARFTITYKSGCGHTICCWQGGLACFAHTDFLFVRGDETGVRLPLFHERGFLPCNSGLLWSGYEGVIAAFDGIRWGEVIRTGCEMMWPVATDPVEGVWFGVDDGEARHGLMKVRMTAIEDYSMLDMPAPLFLAAVDQHGDVWYIAGHSYPQPTAELIRFHPPWNWQRYNAPDELAKYAGFRAHPTLACTPDGSVWVSNGRYGLFRFGGEEWYQFTTEEGLPSNVVGSLAVAGDGSLIAASPAGLCRFDGDSWSVFTTAHGLPADWINDVATDERGIIWLLAGDGSMQWVVRYDGEALQTSDVGHSSHVPALQLQRGPDGKMWACLGSQFVSFDDNELHLFDPGLSDNEWVVPEAMLIDESNVLWAGLRECFVSPASFAFTLARLERGSWSFPLYRVVNTSL
ncbi:MAG: hypothetical protein DRH24_19250, partial [Deltaproteobacteria bacterium]